MAEHASDLNPHIANFLKQNHVAVLATCSRDCIPHAATIYYTLDEDLKIYFLTKENTTKCRNLLQNPKASLVIYEPPTQTTAQINGPVEQITDQGVVEQVVEEITAVAQETAHTGNLPINKLDAGKRMVFCLIPGSIRMAEFKYEDPAHLFDVVTPPETQLDKLDKNA